MDELNGERIDIIQWSDNMEEYIKAALAPAKVAHLDINEKAKRVSVYVQPDQRPLAIGKEGQNVRLASRLVGYELDIMDIGDLSDEDVAKIKPEVADVAELAEQAGLAPEIITKLEAANLTQVAQLKGLSAKDLTGLEDLTEEEAQAVVEAVKGVA
jgi:N utilization substance protein A